MYWNAIKALIPWNKGGGLGAGRGLMAFHNYINYQPTRNFLVPQRRWNPLAILDHTMRDMNRHFKQMEQEMNSVFRNVGFNPEWTSTSLYDSLPALEPEIVKEGDKNKYRLNVFVGENFSPENIKVSLKDRIVTIEAKTDQKSEDGKSRVYQEISRSFTLPEGVNVDELQSLLTPEGVLKFEGTLPKEALPEPPKPKEIPILKA